MAAYHLDFCEHEAFREGIKRSLREHTYPFQTFQCYLSWLYEKHGTGKGKVVGCSLHGLVNVMQRWANRTLLALLKSFRPLLDSNKGGQGVLSIVSEDLLGKKSPAGREANFLGHSCFPSWVDHSPQSHNVIVIPVYIILLKCIEICTY